MLFWEDRWLDGYQIKELAPLLYMKVSRQSRSARTVSEALLDHTWATDIGPELTATMLRQFLDVWQWVDKAHLQTDTRDSI